MNKGFLKALGLLTVGLSLGCTKAVPRFDSLGSGDVPRPRLAWTLQPASSVVSETAFNVQIDILDAKGSLVTQGPDATAEITLSLIGSGSLSGTVSMQATAGRATFPSNLSIDLVGPKTLRATKIDLSGSAGGGPLLEDSSLFNLQHGAAFQLVWATQPLDYTLVGANLLPVIEIHDVYGNVVTTGVFASGKISLTTISGTGPLNGTTALNAIAGVATWTAGQGLNYSTLGSRTMRATLSAFTADSSAFNIVNAPAAPSTLSLSSPLTSPGNNTAPTISVTGSFNLVTVALHKANDCSDAALASQANVSTSPVSLTSSALSEGSHTIYASATDAGNNRSCSAANVLYVVDVTAPTVALSTSSGDPTAVSPILFTAQFSEPVNAGGISAGDFGVTNGSLVGLTQTDGDTWTFQVIPDTGPVSVTVDVAFGVFSDLAGNNNSVGDSFAVDYNGVIVYRLYPTNGANWNDYIAYSSPGLSSDNQAGTACNELSSYYESCIHGAEKKYVVVNATCAGLTLTEDLGVFDWSPCIAFGASQSKFYSRGLKPGKGLRDLVSSSGWILNGVIIRQFGTEIAESVPEAWWSNSVSVITNNSAETSPSTGMVNLASASTIYVVPASQSTIGYLINGKNKISVVTLGSSVLSYNGALSNNCNELGGIYSGADLRSIFCTTNSKFLWFEVNLAGGASNLAHTGIVASGANGWVHSRIHNTKISNLNEASAVLGTGIFMANSHSNLISKLEVTHMLAGGIHLWGSDYNKLVDLNMAYASYSGTRSGLIYLGFGSDFNQVHRARLGFNSAPLATGLTVSSSTGNTVSAANISNIGAALGSGVGFKLSDTARTIITQSVISAIGANAIELSNSDTGSVFSHITAANSNVRGVSLNGNFAQTTFNSFVTANASVGIFSDVSTFGPVRFFNSVSANNRSLSAVQNSGFGTISVVGNFGSTSGETSAADASLAVTYPIDVTSAFVGPLSVNDGANLTPSQSSGTATYSGAMDIFNFENSFRAWGLSLNPFPNALHAGHCTAGETCRVWDWRALASGPLFDVSGSGATINPTYTGGGNCPATVNGTTIASILVSSRTFLLNAIEVYGDVNLAGVRIGNDNGLCEANETCVYAPNIGAYQGEGIAADSCIFQSGGGLTGITILKYPISGI